MSVFHLFVSKTFQTIYGDNKVTDLYFSLTRLVLSTFVLFLNLLQNFAQSLPLRALLQHQLPLDL